MSDRLITRLKNKVLEQAEQIQDKDACIAQQSDMIKQLQQSLGESRAKNNKILEARKKIVEFQREIRKQSEKITAKNQLLSDADVVVNEQAEQIEQNKADMAKYLNQAADMAEHIAELEANDYVVREGLSDIQAENKRLKEFAVAVIREELWGYDSLDGFELQDLAEKLGLIKKHTATEADVDPEHSDYEVGDTIYRFTDILAAQPQGENDEL